MSNTERLLSKMKVFPPLLALALWIPMSAQRLQAQQAACSGDVEAKLNDLGISLPIALAPVANYVPAVRTGNLVFLAGNGAPKS
jgi:hypothetical protein